MLMVWSVILILELAQLLCSKVCRGKVGVCVVRACGYPTLAVIAVLLLVSVVPMLMVQLLMSRLS